VNVPCLNPGQEAGTLFTYLPTPEGCNRVDLGSYWLNSAETAFHHLCLAFHHLILPFYHLKLSLHHLAMPFHHHDIFGQLIFGKIITTVRFLGLNAPNSISAGNTAAGSRTGNLLITSPTP